MPGAHPVRTPVVSWRRVFIAVAVVVAAVVTTAAAASLNGIGALFLTHAYVHM